MSKTKAALPEDVDVTDPRDTGYDGSPNEPSEVDNALNELNRALNTLEKNTCVGYEDELDQYTKRLQRVASRARKPF